MKELLKQLLAMHSEMRKRTNTAMASMQPLDSHQLAGTVSSALREFEWSIERMAEIGTNIDELTASLEAHETSVIAASLAEAIAAGEIFSKESHDGLIVAARTAATAEVEDKYKLEGEKRDLITARRAEITEAHTAVISAAMSDESLEGDDYMAGAQVLASRSTDMGERGITSELPVYGTMLAASEADFNVFMQLASHYSTDTDGKPKKPTITAAKKPGLAPAPAPQGATAAKDENISQEDIAKYS